MRSEATREIMRGEKRFDQTVQLHLNRTVRSKTDARCG